MAEKEISQAVIGRMPRYYRYLGELMAQGTSRISSQELSKLMRLTASQIRQDFNNFGGFGQQGYGYNVKYLHDEIGKILSLDSVHHLIIVGYGNLAHALVNHASFGDNGFLMEAGFDLDEKVKAIRDCAIPLYPISELEHYIETHPVDIAVLTVPAAASRKSAKQLMDCGIKAIWNFTSIDLEHTDAVTVENVHLQDSLMKLSYNVQHNEKIIHNEK